MFLLILFLHLRMRARMHTSCSYREKEDERFTTIHLILGTWLARCIRYINSDAYDSRAGDHTHTHSDRCYTKIIETLTSLFTDLYHVYINKSGYFVFFFISTTLNMFLCHTDCTLFTECSASVFITFISVQMPTVCDWRVRDLEIVHIGRTKTTNTYEWDQSWVSS